MTQPLSADNLLFRASATSNIMTEPVGKSNMEKFNDAKAMLDKYRAEYDAMPKKELKSAIKKKGQIDKYESLLVSLNEIKDEVNLSDTCKAHLSDLFVRLKYDRQTEDINTKYTIKGNEVEELSISLYSRFKKTFFKKNEKHYSNEFLKGTPDIDIVEDGIFGTVVRDVKSSWSIFTFFRTTDEKLNARYYWQITSYMALTGAKRGVIAYCLVNTPANLILSEKRSLQWKMGAIDPLTNELYIEGCKEIERNLIFNIKEFVRDYPDFVLHNDYDTWKWDIPVAERVNEIIIERNEDDIARLYERIAQCRSYMNKELFKVDRQQEAAL